MSQVKYTEEKILKPIKGFVPLFLIIVFILASIGLMILGGILIDEYDSYVLGGVSLGLGILLCIASSISFAGLKVINPN